MRIHGFRRDPALFGRERESGLMMIIISMIAENYREFKAIGLNLLRAAQRSPEEISSWNGKIRAASSKIGHCPRTPRQTVRSAKS